MTGVFSRRKALATGLGLAASGALYACNRPARQSGGPAAPAIDGEIVVGANLELNGFGSVLGKLQEQAMQVGSQLLNTAGVPFGKRRLAIKLVIRDNGGNPEKAAQVSQELIEREKVSAIVGGTTVETALAMVKVAEERKVPLLCLNSGDEMTIPLPQRKFVYKLGPNASDVAAVLSRELRQRNFDKAVLLASPDGHGESGAKAMPRSFSSAGGTITQLFRLPGGGKTFADVAKQVNSAKPKALVIWAQAPASAAAVAAIRAAGYTGPIFLDSGAGADETLRGANGTALNGVFIAHSTILGGAPAMATSTSGLAAREFVYRFIQQYGQFGGFAPYGADALSLIATAVRRANSLDPQRLRGRLEGGAVEGIVGAYAFQPIAHGGLEPDSLVLFTAHQGAWVRV